MALTFFMQACVLGMVVTAFLMASRMRLASLASLYASQALLLAIAVACFGLREGDSAALVVALAILVLKVGIIPRWFVRTARVHQMNERLASYVRPTTASFLAVLAAFFAALIAQTVVTTSASYVTLTAPIALVLIGFLMLITRQDMIGLGFGFLVVENGVFTMGLALTGGMPLLIELGILFDLSILLVLLITFAQRAQKEHASLATDYLRDLIG